MAQRQNNERVSELEEKVREMRMLNARLHTKVYRLEEEIRRMDERLTGMGQKVTACQKEKKELREELERMKRIVDVSVKRILNISKMLLSNSFFHSIQCNTHFMNREY
jgi:uncharacterized coiled-coil DUF342 family protein